MIDGFQDFAQKSTRQILLAIALLYAQCMNDQKIYSDYLMEQFVFIN